MPFIRKRDLLKKQGQKLASQSFVSTQDQSARKQPQNVSNFHMQMQKVRKIEESSSNSSIQNWQKQISEAIGYFIDNKKSLLNTQLLEGYRQILIVLAKYQQELKKKGQQLNEQNASYSLNLFKRIIEDLTRLSQQEKNDQIMHQSEITESILLNLEAFASTLQLEASKNQKRPSSMMRKNSLKKIQEVPSIRPSSRGKLSSLSKKDGLNIKNKQQILGISKKVIETSDRGMLEDMIVGLCSILKNVSANAAIRRQLLNEDTLRLMNRYLSIWNQKNISATGNAILTQLSSSYRHLAVEEKVYKIFLNSNCIETWTRLIQLFPTNQDLIFNILRTLSKLSNYESVCLKLNERKVFLKTLSGFFKFYKANIHIIIRIAITFANMTSYLSDIRNQLYFDFQAWKDIFECFDYYAGRQLSGKNQVDKMGLSMAAWDYQNIKKQSDIECAIRIIRLIANLFTMNIIGQDIYINHSNTYKQLVKKLKGILQKKSNIQKSSELIATILSCLTNIFYYDKQILLSNQEYRTIKNQLIHVLVDFVVQIDNEQICCESLRVVANLTRIKEFCGAVIDAKIHEALMILLESTSKQIVYYCLGVLSNLMGDNNFKQQFKQPVISGIISILNQCDNDDFDLVTLALKTLSSIIDTRNENIDPNLMAEIQKSLLNLGSHCDKLISSVGSGEATEIHESRSLINMLLNSMPEQKFICPIKNCGRKFADEAKLSEHVKRRHKA